MRCILPPCRKPAFIFPFRLYVCVKVEARNAYAVAGFCVPDGMALPGPCTRALDPRPGNEVQTLFQEADRAVGSSPPGPYIHTHYRPPSTPSSLLSISISRPFSHYGIVFFSHYGIVFASCPEIVFC